MSAKFAFAVDARMAFFIGNSHVTSYVQLVPGWLLMLVDQMVVFCPVGGCRYVGFCVTKVLMRRVFVSREVLSCSMKDCVDCHEWQYPDQWLPSCQGCPRQWRYYKLYWLPDRLIVQC